MVELFRIGHVSIYFFGLMIAIAIGIGLVLVYYESKRKKLDTSKVLDFYIYIALAGIIGGRLGFVIFGPIHYLKNPLEIINFSEGGMSIQGSIIVAILFAIWYTRRHKLNFWVLADIGAPALALGQGIGRIGCDIFGLPMSRKFFWGVVNNGQWVHPVQVYEFTLDYIMFYILWRKRKSVNYNGQLFLWYLVMFNIIRALVEFFRPGPYIIRPFTAAHIAAGVLIVGGLLAMHMLKGRNKDNIIESDGVVAVNKVNKYEAIKDGVGVILIYAVSLLIYYFVRG